MNDNSIVKGLNINLTGFFQDKDIQNDLSGMPLLTTASKIHRAWEQQIYFITFNYIIYRSGTHAMTNGQKQNV